MNHSNLSLQHRSSQASRSWPATLCAALAALVGVSGALSAQGDTIKMPPGKEAKSNVPPLPPKFGPNMIVGLQAAKKPVVFPTIQGALQIDPSVLFLLPKRGGFGPELEIALQQVGSKGFQWQLWSGDSVQETKFSPRRNIVPKGFEQIDDEKVCRIRAEKHFDEMLKAQLATGWMQSKGVIDATPIYQPGVEGVAYYHFAVHSGGHIVVSAAEHDAPISHWVDNGLTVVEHLQEIARKNGDKVERIYRLDATCWVGEQQNEIVAQLGNLPPRVSYGPSGAVKLSPWNNWQELKKDYLRVYQPFMERTALEVAGLWNIERGRAKSGWSPWRINFAAGGHSSQRHYDQFQENGCWVGCGPVAWMMLFGWGDRRASLGDRNWSHRWGLYRENGGRGTNAIAPRTNDAGVNNALRELRAQIGTFCAFGSGATAPWDMNRAWRYLSGRTGTTLTAHFNHAGFHDSGLHDMARDEILRGKPAIIGTGWFSHYPLAYGFATRSREVDYFFWKETQHQNWFYLNYGWGGRCNGWYNTGTWFCGRIFAN